MNIQKRKARQLSIEQELSKSTFANIPCLRAEWLRRNTQLRAALPGGEAARNKPLSRREHYIISLYQLTDLLPSTSDHGSSPKPHLLATTIGRRFNQHQSSHSHAKFTSANRRASSYRDNARNTKARVGLVLVRVLPSTVYPAWLSIRVLGVREPAISSLCRKATASSPKQTATVVATACA